MLVKRLLNYPGNSKGLILPKGYVEELGLEDYVTVELDETQKAIIIKKAFISDSAPKERVTPAFDRLMRDLEKACGHCRRRDAPLVGTFKGYRVCVYCASKLHKISTFKWLPNGEKVFQEWLRGEL